MSNSSFIEELKDIGKLTSFIIYSLLEEDNKEFFIKYNLIRYIIRLLNTLKYSFLVLDSSLIKSLVFKKELKVVLLLRSILIDLIILGIKLDIL